MQGPKTSSIASPVSFSLNHEPMVSVAPWSEEMTGFSDFVEGLAERNELSEDGVGFFEFVPGFLVWGVFVEKYG
jgi:hypothetical protein